MGDVIKLPGLKYILTVDQVMETVKDILEDIDVDDMADNQSTHVDMSLYELELLIKEIERLRKLSEENTK